jgi:hypothetical protein
LRASPAPMNHHRKPTYLTPARRRGAPWCARQSPSPGVEAVGAAPAIPMRAGAIIPARAIPTRWEDMVGFLPTMSSHIKRHCEERMRWRLASAATKQSPPFIPLPSPVCQPVRALRAPAYLPKNRSSSFFRRARPGDPEEGRGSSAQRKSRRHEASGSSPRKNRSSSFF